MLSIKGRWITDSGFSARMRLFFRGALGLFLIFYLPWGGLFSFRAKAAVLAGNPAEDTENGMGGGMNPAVSAAGIDGMVDLEISGVQEPEEFFRPQMLAFTAYTVEKGDIIGDIAIKAGLNQDTLLSVNNIRNSRLLQIGQILKIPNQDGINYTVQKGDNLTSLAEKYQTETAAITAVNELFSDSIQAGSVLFIPGAKMDDISRQEINGDLFIWPVSGYITSLYGYRSNPFGGGRQFHTGLDIGAAMGTAVKAAMIGRVSTVGSDNVLGNYIIINHHSGYRTVYAHLSATRVKPGDYVNVGQRIGDVGSTGQSTGPHLHFTVYKNGVTVNPRALIK